MRGKQTGVEQGEAVLADALSGFRDALGSRLIAAYALGSLAHGGFSSLVSDVDLGLVLADPLRPEDDEMLLKVADRVKAGGSALHERLSVFWGTPSTLQGSLAGGRFPPLDRLDLLEYGRLLEGEDARAGMARPTQLELLVVGAEFALDYLGGGRGSLGPAASGLGSMSPERDAALQEIRRPGLLVSRGVRRLTKIVLFPVRFLYTAATGRVGTNHLAVEHFLAGPQTPGAELAGAALGWRLAPPDDNEVAGELLGRELIPLYLHYIDDHTARLTTVGRADLAESFTQWRRRLLA